MSNHSRANGILGTLLPIFAVLNPLLSWGGGAVAIIWLLALGQWRIILIAVAAALAGMALYSFIVFPVQLLLMGAINALGKIWQPLVRGAMVVANLFTALAVAGWSLFVVSFVNIFTSAYEVSFWPLLLLGYLVATGPIASMAQGEEKLTDSAAVLCILSQLSYLVLAVCLLSGSFSFMVVATVLLAGFATLLSLRLLRQRELAEYIQNMVS